VNDTFTALTCIDWLGDSLCKITASRHPRRVLRDSHGYARVITSDVRYNSLVERAFEKIRQASGGMPAVMIRQLEELTKIMEHATTADHPQVLLEQAQMIYASGLASIPEPRDLADVKREYDKVLRAERGV
jgi:uncharacterized membrane protein